MSVDSVVSRKWKKMEKYEQESIATALDSSVAYVNHIMLGRYNCSKKFALAVEQVTGIDRRKIMFPELYP